jgi:bifunctional non-homologous end joining protein LigD
MPKQANALKDYREKRNFAVTPEPGASAQPGGRRKNGLLYAVQKHAASHLHYDFRLEWDGVLLSWAIPKGPSLRPSVKRLAVRTEDHPLAYGGFEGVIPDGEYGAGTVMLWDTGTWIPEEPDVNASLQQGELRFGLFGEKLRGSWVLVRAATGYGTSKQHQWLLIKRKDRYASTSDILTEEPRSVTSNRLLVDIARAENGNVPMAARGDAPGRRSSRSNAGKLM